MPTSFLKPNPIKKSYLSDYVACNLGQCAIEGGFHLARLDDALTINVI